MLNQGQPIYNFLGREQLGEDCFTLTCGRAIYGFELYF